MSFVTTQPEALAAAAGNLQGIGSTLSAQNAAAAAPTTGVVPAAADEVSALQAAQFSAYGTLYQQVSAQAAAIHEMFVSTLKTSAESYGATEGANAIAAGAAGTPSASLPLLSTLHALGANSMVADLGEGASTGICYIPSSLAPSMIGYLTAASGNAAGGGTAGAGIGALLAPGGPLSALGGLSGGAGGAAGAASSAASATSATAPAVSASMGQASLVGSFSAPPGWSAATSAGSAAALPSAGWAVPPESNSMAAMPGGMPGVGSGRGGFGFGAPRYGFKPTVMPRPVMVG